VIENGKTKMINKKCDFCKKEIEVKGNADYPWSEWAVFHHRKRRDFCCLDCFKKWLLEYCEEKESKDNKDITVKHLINKLVECNMDDNIIIRDKDGERIKPVSINVKEAEGLSCLFG